MTSPAETWGLPNWKDPTSYGAVNEWSFHRWRWEFYRRQDFRREAFQLLSQTETGEMQFMYQDRPPKGTAGHFVYFDGSERTWGYSLRFPDPSVSNHPEELLFALPDVTADFEVEIRTGTDSTLDHIEGLGLFTSDAQRAEAEYLAGSRPVVIRKGWELLAFDPRLPIGPQLKIAERYLLMRQMELVGEKVLDRRRHPAKWLGYLRTLDARECLATWAEIASIHPTTAQTEQTARDIWQQATALRFNF